MTRCRRAAVMLVVVAALCAVGLSTATPAPSFGATCAAADIKGGVKAVPSNGDGCEIHHIPSQDAEKRAGQYERAVGRGPSGAGPSEGSSPFGQRRLPRRAIGLVVIGPGGAELFSLRDRENDLPRRVSDLPIGWPYRTVGAGPFESACCALVTMKHGPVTAGPNLLVEIYDDFGRRALGDGGMPKHVAGALIVSMDHDPSRSTIDGGAGHHHGRAVARLIEGANGAAHRRQRRVGRQCGRRERPVGRGRKSGLPRISACREGKGKAEQEGDPRTRSGTPLHRRILAGMVAASRWRLLW